MIYNKIQNYLVPLFLRLLDRARTEKFWFILFPVIVFPVALIRYISHSEFWSIFYSKYLFEPGNFQDSLYSKVIFHLPLKLIHYLPLGNIAHIIAAKILSGFLACGILFFTFKILRLKLDVLPAALVVCFLYFNPLVFWDLPQLKADLFCLFYMLAAVWSWGLQKRKAAWFFLLLAILTTPKFILFFPLMLVIASSQISFSDLYSFKFKLWTSRILVFAVFAVIFNGFNLIEKFLAIINNFETYRLVLRYIINAFKFSTQFGFFDPNLMFYVNIFLIHIFLSFLLFFLLHFFQKKYLISKKNSLLFFISLIFFITAVGLYPLKHPYFLIPLVFLLVLAILINLRVETLALKEIKFVNYFVFFHFVFAAVGLRQISTMNFGIDQFVLLERLDQIVSINPSVLIVDGTGALPRANNFPQFFGVFDDANNTLSTKQIIEKRPDLLILSPKLSTAFAELFSFVDINYILFAPHVVAKKISLGRDGIQSVEKILAALKSELNYSFSVLSFRSELPKLKNNVLPSVCEVSGIVKESWTVQELEKCTNLIFSSKQDQEIFVVAWPAYAKEWSESVSQNLNFKFY